MNVTIMSSMTMTTWGGDGGIDGNDGSSMLPTGLAPLEGGFENAGPKLMPPLVKGTLPDVNGEGTKDKVVMVMMTGTDNLGGNGADKMTPPTIPLSAPTHHRARIAPHAHKNAPPPLAPSSVVGRPRHCQPFEGEALSRQTLLTLPSSTSSFLSDDPDV